MTSASSFPERFAWGVATSAYQIEGAVREGARVPSIWDTFSRHPGAVVNGDKAETACDHYHRYTEDVGHIADLGVENYRFSFAWPRLMPVSSGALTPAGVAFYDRLIDSLLERGIRPWVTLYHWDLPQLIQDEGGWSSRDTVLRFVEYAGAVHERFSDRVKWWTTFNEPWVAAFLGYAAGTHAPGVRDDAAALRAAHHMLLAHGLAVRQMRAQDDGTSNFGITLNLQPVVAATVSEADRDAARRVDGLANRLFLDPLLRGSYPNDVRQDLAGITDFGHLEAGDEGVINAELDFLGVNYYYRSAVRAGDFRPGAPSPWVGARDVEFITRDLPMTEMGWEIDPRGLYEVLTRVAEDYSGPVMYITENGGAFPDARDVDGLVRDTDRIAFIRAHLEATLEAISDGADVRGYFAWSLLDNFEWAEGFSKRFGLIHVDYESQVRTPKASAQWFKAVCAANGVSF